MNLRPALLLRPRRQPRSRPSFLRPLAVLAACTALAAPLAAQPASQPAAQPVSPLAPQAVAEALVLVRNAAGALAPAGARVRVQAGELDPRLRLAPCARVQPYLAAGSPPWGRTRVGLRCLQGAARWNVFLPVQVEVLAPAVVAGTALPAGARLESAQFGQAEVDWAAAAAPPFTDAPALAGRVLARPVGAGQPLRPADLKPQQWFAAGDTVRIAARGAGFTVESTGQALTHGLEGQSARVRTEGGRIVVGQPVGERRLELPL